MKMGYNSYEKERGFNDIVFNAEQKILDILSRELRLYKRVIPMGEHRSEIVLEEEDTRESFVQAVQGLALILKPYFDKQINNVYGDFDDVCDISDYEFLEKKYDYLRYIINMEIKTIKLAKENKIVKLNDITEEEINNRLSGITRDDIKNYLIKYKVKRAKQIFRELNLLLKRVDYLKSAVYGEGDDNDEVVEDDSEGGD